MSSSLDLLFISGMLARQRSESLPSWFHVSCVLLVLCSCSLSSLYLAEPAITNVGLCYPLESQRVCFVWRPNSCAAFLRAQRKALPSHCQNIRTCSKLFSTKALEAETTTNTLVSHKPGPERTCTLGDPDLADHD